MPPEVLGFGYDAANVGRIEGTVVIERPVEAVWKLLTDMEAFSIAWGEHYTLTSAGPLGVGSTVAEDDGTVATFTEFEPNHRYTFSIEGDSRLLRRVIMGFELEPVGKSTRLKLWAQFAFKGGLRLLEPIVLPYWKLLGRKPMANLKRTLEAGG